MQPYTTRPQDPELAPLEVMRKLDNIDKHRVILTGVGAVDANFHGEPSNYRGKRPEPDYNFCLLEEGARVATFTCSEPSPDLEIPEFDILPTVDLVYDDSNGVRFDAKRIMWDMKKAVLAAVEAFEPF